MSCRTCHQPEHGWSDPLARSVTASGKPNLRHTRSLYNLAWASAFGWDGRFNDLRDVVLTHWRGQLAAEPEALVEHLKSDPSYPGHFARLEVEPSVDAVAEALAAFAATRYAGDSPWDRFERGDRKAASAEVERGYQLFIGKAQCSMCHPPPLYTDDGFHRLGLVGSADDGRGLVDPSAKGAFRTPTLRGAALHPPYFHDGSAPTLEAAIDWHLAGGTGQGADRTIVDPALVPMALPQAERRALIAFVRALSDAEQP